MDDYISRQTAIDVAIKMFNAWYGHSLLRTNEIRARFEQLPSADVQPVQRGHWQEANTRTYGIYECDICKGWTYIPNKPRDYKFCPRCGARMDGDKNDRT